MQEYVTDVAYVRGFEKNLSPARLRLCAALNGFRSPPADDFDYCELGCAQADTMIALAAAYPRARFVGVDLNPAHLTIARTTAMGGEVGNVRFVERDFEALVEDDLPKSDYVVAHGVLSWVSPQKRRAVINVMSRTLHDGGLAYVSYNALPGWAAVEPLRQLIVSGAAIASGDSAERAKAGLDLARAFEAANAGYFEANPAARKMLATMATMSLSYVVHEYLHAHWVPMYFAQLAAEMAERGLYFVGQLPAYLNYRDLAIPKSLEHLFHSVTDRIAFEGLKDFALDTYFRTDVFVKGIGGRDDSITREYLDATPFGMAGDERANAPREAKLANHTLRFHGDVFDALLPALEKGSASVGALAARGDFTSFDRTRLRDAMLHLLLGDRVAPMREPTVRRDATGALALPNAYNRWVLQRGFAIDVPIVLAAPVLGNGVPLTIVEGAGLDLALERDRSQHAAWIHAFCNDLSHVVVGDRRVEDKRELEAIVAREAERFRAERLPKLIELGVVTCD
jgi:SAM-dependent methyltransferase